MDRDHRRTPRRPDRQGFNGRSATSAGPRPRHRSRGREQVSQCRRRGLFHMRPRRLLTERVGAPTENRTRVSGLQSRCITTMLQGRLVSDLTAMSPARPIDRHVPAPYPSPQHRINGDRLCRAGARPRSLTPRSSIPHPKPLKTASDAGVVELVDTRVSNTRSARSVGSNPTTRTIWFDKRPLD